MSSTDAGSVVSACHVMAGAAIASPTECHIRIQQIVWANVFWVTNVSSLSLSL